MARGPKWEWRNLLLLSSHRANGVDLAVRTVFEGDTTRWVDRPCHRGRHTLLSQPYNERDEVDYAARERRAGVMSSLNPRIRRVLKMRYLA